MQKTWVWFLVWEDPLEKRMAIHFSILARRIPRTEEPSGLITAWPNPRARDFTLKFQNAEYTVETLKPLGIPPHPVPSNSQRQWERECRALFWVIMSRQDLAWPAGHDENGKQMASKFPRRGARGVERGRRRPPHPHPLPFQSCQTFPLFYFLSHWD